MFGNKFWEEKIGELIFLMKIWGANGVQILSEANFLGRSRFLWGGNFATTFLEDFSPEKFQSGLCSKSVFERKDMGSKNF